MKYGSELSRRSVPEWRAHNIAYNDIKALIKRATTQREGSSKSSQKRSFNWLFDALVSEYESVSIS